MPFLMSILTRGALFLGGLFGLSWAGESIATKLGRIVTYIVFGVSSILALAPRYANKIPLVKGLLRGAKTKSIRFGSIIISVFLGVWLFAKSAIEKYRDLTKPWYQFW